MQIVAANHVRSATKRRLDYQTTRHPDEEHAERRRPETEPAQALGVESGDLRHAAPHRIGKSRQQQPLDGENEPDRGAEVPHVTSPPAAPARLPPALTAPARRARAQPPGARGPRASASRNSGRSRTSGSGSLAYRRL